MVLFLSVRAEAEAVSEAGCDGTRFQQAIMKHQGAPSVQEAFTQLQARTFNSRVSWLTIYFPCLLQMLSQTLLMQYGFFGSV
jgi:hypothetical protein